MARNEKVALRALPPPTEHARFCQEAGPPAMVWHQQIAPGMPVMGHCVRCGAVGRKVVR